jgi:hypothetical protein
MQHDDLVLGGKYWCLLDDKIQQITCVGLSVRLTMSGKPEKGACWSTGRYYSRLETNITKKPGEVYPTKKALIDSLL